MTPVEPGAARGLQGPARGRRGPRKLALQLVPRQLPADKWNQSMADATLADAVVHRLFHASHRIAMDGASHVQTPARADALSLLHLA